MFQKCIEMSEEKNIEHCFKRLIVFLAAELSKKEKSSAKNQGKLSQAVLAWDGPDVKKDLSRRWHAGGGGWGR